MIKAKRSPGDRWQDFYVQWRLRGRKGAVLQDSKGPPAEHLLQLVWFHQRLLRENLRTLDGKRVQVLHPGFWSHEGGPDFRSAVIQFDSEKPVSGDVEVDLHPSGWRAHRHHENAAFTNVILHVVWEGGPAGNLPILPLKSVLDAPVEELLVWIGADAGRSFPEALKGQCSAPLRDLSEERLVELLQQAARVRMEAKAAQLQARARQAGWEQALWEGLFRALGYKHNTWPMLRLGELRERFVADPKFTTWHVASAEPVRLQALLLGAGGLLPFDLTSLKAGTHEYARQLWDFWWRERETLLDCTLPRSLWHLHGLRPANHPQRRLALASHWLAGGKLVAGLEKWCAERDSRCDRDSLLEILQVPADRFWNWHWTLRSQKLAHSQPLLGQARATDLAINVILPWLWSRAVERKNEAIGEEMERRYFAWPAGEDNAPLRLARQRLLGTNSAKLFRYAALQQGLLQILRDFCERSDSLCTNCQFPELVRSWNQPAIPIRSG